MLPIICLIIIVAIVLKGMLGDKANKFSDKEKKEFETLYKESDLDIKEQKSLKDRFKKGGDKGASSTPQK